MSILQTIMNADTKNKIQNDTALKLLKEALTGNKAAREELAMLTSKLIYIDTYRKYKEVGLQHFTTDDIKDFNQDILISLFKDDCKRLRSFKGKSSYARWIYVIVINALIDKKRSRAEANKEKTISINQPISEDPDAPSLENIIRDMGNNPAETLIYNSLVEKIREALSSMKEEDQTIIYLWCSRKYTEKEIGLILNMNANTVATRIHRVQIAILNKLKEEGYNYVK